MMTVLDFAEEHDINPSHLHVAKNHGKLPQYIFHKHKGARQTVDETYILRRRRFREYIQQRNQEMYYILSERYSDTDMAVILADKTDIPMSNWRSWIGSRLWYPIPPCVMSYYVPRYQYLFHKYIRQTVRRLENDDQIHDS